MQGDADLQRQWLDVESVAGHLLPSGSVFALLAAQRGVLFPAEMFEDLFPSGKGRPSLPAESAASVIVLQSLFGLSDREAAEAVRFDLRWKAACGFALDAKGFHPTTLTLWRRRLAASKRPHRIFEVVREVIVSSGAIAGKSRRALDSTVFDDAVARQDTVTQLIASIRRVARVVDGAGAVVGLRCTRLAGVCGQDYTVASKPRIAWDDRQAQDELISALVGDALALLAGLDVEAISEGGGAEAEAVALLALVAGQDVEPAEGSDGTDGRWRVARKTAPDRVISTVDPQARHAHKTQHRQQDGFKGHVSVEPETGLITEAAMTKASGPENSDAAVGQQLLTRDPTISEYFDRDSSGDPHATDGSDTGGEVTDCATEGEVCGVDHIDSDSECGAGVARGPHGVGGQIDPRLTVLGDSAFSTGPMLALLHALGCVPVVKPWHVVSPIPDGFTLYDFVVDPAGNSVTCPNGVTRVVRPSKTANFGMACADCPLRARCTNSKSGRSVTLGEHHQLRRGHRKWFAGNDVQNEYRQHRPMVERSIAWLTRGNRRVPYRGLDKNDAWLLQRVAALNLRRLATMGLTHTSSHGWVLT